MTEPALEITWSPTARRALTKLPEKVGTATIEFIFGPLATNRRRVGKPLRFELVARFMRGVLSQRRGVCCLSDYRGEEPAHTLSCTWVAGPRAS